MVSTRRAAPPKRRDHDPERPDSAAVDAVHDNPAAGPPKWRGDAMAKRLDRWRAAP